MTNSRLGCGFDCSVEFASKHRVVLGEELSFGVIAHITHAPAAQVKTRKDRHSLARRRGLPVASTNLTRLLTSASTTTAAGSATASLRRGGSAYTARPTSGVAMGLLASRHVHRVH
jgi:hypothetical protein